MDQSPTIDTVRRPRFRRASEPLAFRITAGDVEILRQLARHRFLRSTHIAALVRRSLDRTNDRLARLFHGGYIDRPRAQLDFYPTSGSVPMVYALSDRGARLLCEQDTFAVAHRTWRKRNREAGRPFIEHQLEVMDFYVGLELATRDRTDVACISPEELIAAMPESTRTAQNPIAMRVKVTQQGTTQTIGIVPDLIFGLRYPDGSRRCFMVEIDRGTMPIIRAYPTQTSFERKMRGYLSAHASQQHERQFGWKTFRVLTITTDSVRIRSMQDVLSRTHVPRSPGPGLFFFATRDDLGASNPLLHRWKTSEGRSVTLL